MKKLTNKLQLSKETLANLDDKQMAAVKGGFTYSLSTGACAVSKALGAGNAYACGYAL
ncbi:MAG: rSAM-modified peptide [Gorillibacterium sp.]|nr:rSAM-modified peptide [Gorillibacterium sp.]